MSDLSVHDRFTLPGEIADPFPSSSPRTRGPSRGEGAEAHWAPACAGVTTEGDASDWQARGLKHPAGRGWEPEVRYEVIEHRFPDGMPDDPVAALGQQQVFTRERQVRFLDHLATTGNVRVSAQRACVSRETAYRLRRRDAEFAALWDAALVHARERVAGIAGDRALEGVMEEVWFRGELVGHRRRYDARLLLAHLARLDRLVAPSTGSGGAEIASEAALMARRFDAGLARLAGHPEPEGFAEAAEVAREEGACEEGEDPRVELPVDVRERALPPSQGQFWAWRVDAALKADDSEDEAQVMEAAGREADAIYTAWEAGLLAAVDAVLSAADLPQDPVTRVNTVQENSAQAEFSNSNSLGERRERA